MVWHISFCLLKTVISYTGLLFVQNINQFFTYEKYKWCKKHIFCLKKNVYLFTSRHTWNFQSFMSSPDFSSISDTFCMNQHTVRRRWRRDYDRFMAAFGKTFGFGFHPGQQDTCQTYYSVFLLALHRRKVNCQIFVMYISDRHSRHLNFTLGLTNKGLLWDFYTLWEQIY